MTTCTSIQQVYADFNKMKSCLTEKVVVYISPENARFKVYIGRIPFVKLSNDPHSPCDYSIGPPRGRAIAKKGYVVTRSFYESHIKLFENYDVECYYIYNSGVEFAYLRAKNTVHMFPTISFIVQGKDVDPTFPLTCVLFLHGYLVCSTWNIHKCVEEVKQHVIDKDIYNNQNVFFQNLTILMGLTCVHTEYTIKVRSDEIYTNLIPFIRSVLMNPRKITTLNIFLRKTDWFPFHISDHIMGGKTKEIKKLCIGAELLIHHRVPYKKPKMFKEWFWVPEQIFGLGYLINYYPLYHLNCMNAGVLMNTHFTSVDINSLMPMIIVYTYWYHEGDELKNKKVEITPDNWIEHQSFIVDLESYYKLLEN